MAFNKISSYNNNTTTIANSINNNNCKANGPFDSLIKTLTAIRYV